MVQRYVRVQSSTGIHYGLLQLNREVIVLDAAPWAGGQANGQTLGSDDYELLTPCLPSKIVAIGRNYAKHAAEMGNEVPSYPLIFLKPPTALQAPQQPIYYPSQLTRVDYEGELAVVIGCKASSVSIEEAGNYIWGYTVANDVTARDLQRTEQQWTRSKGFDTFCPLGPWIVPQINPDALLQTFINDNPQPVQSAPINQMVFSPGELIAFISGVMTLLPGDVILTGTPQGIGPLQVGDRVRVEVEGIGSLDNPVVAR
ncbi:fumarylacetoacetate hydrolase family protein [Thermosynechococcaceae cyanobacterium BACA0444]|uniref:Fumarylacetoacetate hydrolase family protein n=1 Tax=Pseudocalidococcus azoricus BACA0444 TaxID=2918990 RepID=A0AAE4FTG0_9CYAN|nr:fumarylacetoacetate hydrolase family protein [Pseudocalidococcus azoricus]MDS3861856.1 fumarylacetoacetate hydrolase family protein [Pseudocalidococcus azoricus BACA0444]